MVARDITVFRANRECRSDRDVRQSETCQSAANDVATELGARNGFIHVQMQYGAACILLLQVFLHFQSFERIVRIGNRQLRAVGVVRMIWRPRLKNLRETLLIFFGKAVSCTFSRCGFKVVHVSGFFLEHDHLVADEIKHFGGKGVAGFRRNVFFVLCEVADHFIDAIHTDRREVITQRAEITSCIREQALIHMALNDLALNFKAVAG